MRRPGEGAVLGHEGRDAQIVCTEWGDVITGFTRFLATPQRVFFLQYLAFGDHFTTPPAEFRSFVDSFRLADDVGASA